MTDDNVTPLRAYHYVDADEFDELVAELERPQFPVLTSEYDFDAIEKAGLALMKVESPLAPAILAWCLKARPSVKTRPADA